jgi:phenylacetic acid degradation operon negative regulatory protein
VPFRAIMQHPLTRQLGEARTENSFYTALARLKRRGAVLRTKDRQYELTQKGEYQSLKAQVRLGFTELEKTEARASKWDGRWRVVLFDVPESKRPIRDYIRNTLKRLGCHQFMRSMWIWPYKLPDFLMELFADPKLRNYTRVITTYDIDYDEDLLKQFKLH